MVTPFVWENFMLEAQVVQIHKQQFSDETSKELCIEEGKMEWGKIPTTLKLLLPGFCVCFN